MEQERSNGFRRNSSHHGIYSRPIERRPSKKSSSKDRHGMVYPDSFQQATIRTVTPDSVSDTGNHSSLSEPDFAPAATASPRSTARSRNPDWDPRREFSPYHSAGDEDEPTTEAKGQRARSKTTTLDEQRSEISPSFLTRTRNRLGSINATTTPLNTKVSEESVGSIGYPSIIQSPTYAGPPGPRQRLTKPPPGGGPGLITGVSRNPAAFLSPLSNADSAKILQLMKTTCGRMHGILSFRTASNTQWSSGYCAINVASGSLIYQAKGEVTQAKTLIPDLRGCHVRTLFDTELQSTYLSVSTFSSGLGLQLKPHVNETFDSWLAALLCWQPIRPKGVQNKRTKPQSVTIGDRRFNDSRRNSESTGQKDAAIIKIGNMLLWEKPTVSGARPVPGWKTLTYRQQKQSPAWQSVSGALHENGYFKLFTEASSRSEQSLLAVIQLSRLARCAVQQLEPSVLGGEYCIAIYPQYAAVAASDSTERPVFLSLETRVLFEVWFVLLRAFTIPELYGPETATPEEPVRPPNALNPPNTPITDMFRNERVVTVRITEAKLTNTSKKELDPSTGKVHSIPSEATIPSDYYAEVLLDGEVRAKTAVREKTCNPFWREDFIFLDLPPVLSNVSVLLKTLNPAQKDWTLIAHGPYTLDAQVNPMTILDDLEVSSHDATCGRVDLHLDELESGSDVEKWWPIIDDRDQVVGDMYMKVRLEETIVLMSHEYEPLSELLHAFPNNLTIHMVQILPTDLNILSSLLLNIFQVSGQAADWIAALVEDEIDGFGRDATSTAHNHFRYTARLHSNDSKESGQDREVIVRDLGRSATIEANLLFRGNSLLTKALDMHMRRLGKDYLEETIGERIRDLDESDPECEVDPMRVERPEDLERNWRNLIGLTSLFWKSIAASASKCPPELRRIFRHVRACAEDRYGDFLRSVTYSSVSGFLFLRFFCPAILNPKLFALMKEHPRPRAQRTLTLIAKALQGLANMTTFGSKEPWMEPMNKFLLTSRGAFKEFVDSICSISAERPTQVVTPQYATPIQILGRLPETSKEGFPSLPFLIDQARCFAALIKIWLKNAPPRLRELEETDPNIIKFNALALQIQQRTRECFSKAEQAERPNGNYEVKWEELVESMDRSITFYDDASKAETPAAETPLRAPPVSSSKRNSIGYFPARPTSRRSIDTGGEGDEDTPPSSSSATWEQHRLPFTRARSSDPRESGTSSRNSSQHSLENPEGSKSRHSTIGREAASKLRLLDLVPGPSRRKHKD